MAVKKSKKKGVPVKKKDPKVIIAQANREYEMRINDKISKFVKSGTVNFLKAPGKLLLAYTKIINTKHLKLNNSSLKNFAQWVGQGNRMDKAMLVAVQTDNYRVLWEAISNYIDWYKKRGR